MKYGLQVVSLWPPCVPQVVYKWSTSDLQVVPICNILEAPFFVVENIAHDGSFQHCTCREENRARVQLFEAVLPPDGQLPPFDDDE